MCAARECDLDTYLRYKRICFTQHERIWVQDAGQDGLCDGMGCYCPSVAVVRTPANVKTNGQGKPLRAGSLLEPVRVEVIPAGVSLDTLADLRARRLNGKKGRRRRGELGSENTAKQQSNDKPPPPPDLFSFINTHLAVAAPADPSPAPVLLRKQGRSKEEKIDVREIHKTLFGVQERIHQLEKQLGQEQEAFERNHGRDRAAGKKRDRAWVRVLFLTLIVLPPIQPAMHGRNSRGPSKN